MFLARFFCQATFIPALEVPSDIAKTETRSSFQADAPKQTPPINADIKNAFVTFCFRTKTVITILFVV
jgi:hypothetical protein